MEDELSEDRKAILSDYEKAMEIVALHVFEYNSTMAARVALGHGLDRETVAMSLESLAEAIRTQDCAEDMSPIGDGHTLSQVFV